MPLSGKGMLITVMDADPAEEEDFNKWYDREHIVERVAIAGFLEARRYVAALASPKYLNLYCTEKLETLDSPAYRDKLQNATPWTRHHSSKFRNYTRVAARVTVSKGQGRGGTLAFSRIRPSGSSQSELRKAILARFDSVAGLDRIISTHLLEADPMKSAGRSQPPTTQEIGMWSWRERMQTPCSGPAISVSDRARSFRIANQSRSGPIDSCGILAKPSLIADFKSQSPRRCAALQGPNDAVSIG
jgi:hypothetical protein